MSPILTSEDPLHDIPVTWEQLRDLQVTDEDINRGFTYFESVKQLGRYRSIKAAIERVTLGEDNLRPVMVQLYRPQRMGFRVVEAGFTVRGVLKLNRVPYAAVTSSRWLTLPDGRDFELATLRLTTCTR